MHLTTSAAWRYHQATNHSLESLRRNRQVLDWPNQPRPYKRYVAPLPSVPLPSQWARLSEGTLDAALLAKLLQLGAGITKHLRFPGGVMAFRAAACTGALYHIDLYVVCGELPGIPAGVYHFDVERAALTRLREGDFRRVLVHATAGDERVRHAPAMIVASSTWWRNAWKYQSRTYRHAFWDSGTILANLLAVAAEHSLPANVLLGFVDSHVNRLLDIDPDREAALELIPLGHTETEPPPAPEVQPLGLDIEPYSFREIDYPLIRDVHDATSLATAERVRAFSQARASDSSPMARNDEPIEAVIRRRGSARRFATTQIGRDQLEALLGSISPPPGDWGEPLSDAYLILNAVDGLDNGAYFWNRDTGQLEALRLGEYREIARHLDLGQDLAGDAALNVYFLADLAAALERLGERGYRAAQLDASLTAGKLYLASYALGLAATGLTFFDDDVVDFFSPHAAGTSVMFLLAVGERLRP
ncbi:MAG TPA: SagB/ThcOx family dehydrogenase [Chloroflexota bacterium]